jgi:hypothetical protein
MSEIILKRRRYSVFCKYSSRKRRERDSLRCRGEKVSHDIGIGGTFHVALAKRRKWRKISR